MNNYPLKHVLGQQVADDGASPPLTQAVPHLDEIDVEEREPELTSLGADERARGVAKGKAAEEVDFDRFREDEAIEEDSELPF